MDDHQLVYRMLSEDWLSINFFLFEVSSPNPLDETKF